MGGGTVLRKVTLLILCVAKPVRRPRAFATLQNLVINLKANVVSAFAVFAHSNYPAHAPILRRHETADLQAKR